MDIQYAVQPSPDGLAQAFVIGEDFSATTASRSCSATTSSTAPASARTSGRNTEVDGATIFAYHVADPTAYGVVEFDDDFTAVSIEEKPPSRSRTTPSRAVLLRQQGHRDREDHRAECPWRVEISTVNERYLEAGELGVQVLDRGTAWLDTGTFESMMQASEYVKVIEDRQGFKIGCIEEIAWRYGWIDDAQLAELAAPLVKGGYGVYLQRLLAA